MSLSLLLLLSGAASAAVSAFPSHLPQEPGFPGDGSEVVQDGDLVTLQAARGETAAVVLRTDASDAVAVALSALEGPGTLDDSALLEMHQGYFGYLDALIPVDAATVDESTGVLVRIPVPRDAAAGTYEAEVLVGDDALTLELVVLDLELPEVPTWISLSPRWSNTSSAWRPRGLDGALAELDALWRGRMTPVHDFPWKQPWRIYEDQASYTPSWELTDGSESHHVAAVFEHYFADLGGNMIDVDLYYGLGEWEGGLDPFDDQSLSEFVAGYLQDTQSGGGYSAAAWFMDNGWDGRFFVQSHADEPEAKGYAAYDDPDSFPGEDRQHCSYRYVQWYSELIRAANTDWPILLAEHATPQLLEWVDIFNTSWTHANPGDADELVAMGKKLLWYSADIKTPANMVDMRARYWRGFARGVHGSWTWERYAYLPESGSSESTYRQGMVYEIGSFGQDAAVPVISARIEAQGEGADDFELLGLLAERDGTELARSFAQATLSREDSPRLYAASNADGEDLVLLRRTLDFLLTRESVSSWVLADETGLASVDGIELLPWDSGRASLAPTDTRVVLDGASLEDVEALGSMELSLSDGGVLAQSTGDVSSGRHGLELAYDSFEDLAEIRLTVEAVDLASSDSMHRLGLFDLRLVIDDQEGSELDWVTGEYGRTLGHHSLDGTLDGEPRHVAVDLAHTQGFGSHGHQSQGLAVYLGSDGYSHINLPWADADYAFRVDEVELVGTSRESSGEIVTEPVAISDEEASYLWWSTEVNPLDGTEVAVQVRRVGDSEWVGPEPVAGLVHVARIPDGEGEIEIRAVLEGDGASTPMLHAIGVVGGAAVAADTGPGLDDTGPGDASEGGCRCNAAAAPGGTLLLLLAPWLVRRREGRR
jgi:hypothetical protein